MAISKEQFTKVCNIFSLITSLVAVAICIYLFTQMKKLRLDDARQTSISRTIPSDSNINVGPVASGIPFKVYSSTKLNTDATKLFASLKIPADNYRNAYHQSIVPLPKGHIFLESKTGDMLVDAGDMSYAFVHGLSSVRIGKDRVSFYFDQALVSSDREQYLNIRKSAFSLLQKMSFKSTEALNNSQTWK